MNAVWQFFHDPDKDDVAEDLYTEEDRFLAALRSADDVYIDGHGIAVRTNNTTIYHTHEEVYNLDAEDEWDELTEDIIMMWIDEDEERQVDNPDYLPYDRRAGF